MDNIRTIKKKIDDIARTLPREEKRALNTLKKNIVSYNDKIYYEANYDKRFCISNYNKFINDIADLNRTNFYILFIKIKNLSLSYHLQNDAYYKAVEFLEEVKVELPNLELLRKEVYIVEDYLCILAHKNDVNKVYEEVKAIKESKRRWSDYQMTYIRYKKTSSKINKNVNACIKEAERIFGGERV